MEKILNNGAVVLFDEADLSIVSSFNWWANSRGYVCANTYSNGVHGTVRMHRIIMNCPDNLFVDHINLNPLDNRRSNLRICTRRQNNRNMKKNSTNTSGYKGVYFHKKAKKWAAIITADLVRYHIGLFLSPEEAHDAYCQKAKELHGEFARFE